MERIHLTQAAREEAQRALAAGQPSVVTISYVTGCGASGFLVRLTRNGIPDVEPVEVGGLLVSMDAVAVQRLGGATVDFTDRDGWMVEHPDAVEPTPC